MKPLKQRSEELASELIASYLSGDPMKKFDPVQVESIIYNALINLDIEIRENIIEAIEEIR